MKDSQRQKTWVVARRGVLGLVVAAMLPGFLAGGAAASAAAPAGATNLSVDGGTARLLGPEALVAVHCEGPRDGICSGTLSVSSGGRTRTAPYSVFAGSQQRLTVAVGDGFASPGSAVIAVARTAQPAGGIAQSRAVLRFR
jgi:hypothetical protein